MNESPIINPVAFTIGMAAFQIASQYECIEPARRATLINIANEAMLLAATIEGVSLEVVVGRILERVRLSVE